MTAKTSLGLLLLSALMLTACSQRLNTTDVESRIKADIERQGRRLSLKAVRCPADIPRQAGSYFRCVGELDPDGTFTINVIQQDDAGTVTWEVPNSKVMLNLMKVENSLQEGLVQALGKRAVVDCGTATYRANQPGDRFECQIVGGLTDGSTTINAVLVKVDTSGNLDWQELRSPNPIATASASAPTVAAPAPGPGSASARGVSTPGPPTTPATGPTGRPINRPYIPGDND